MDPFRLSLLVIGLVVIAAIYLWGRSRRRRDEWLDPETLEGEASDEGLAVDSLRAERHTPMELSQLEALSGLRGSDAQTRLDDALLAGLDAEAATGEAEPAPVGEALLVLSVMAPEGRWFAGEDIAAQLRAAGLRFGAMDIYHWHAGENGPAIFSLANILEPGTFDPQQMAGFKTPGLALFLQLPGPLAGEVALERFFHAAEQLAGGLHGQVCDAKRQPLDDTRRAQMREEAARFPAVTAQPGSEPV